MDHGGVYRKEGLNYQRPEGIAGISPEGSPGLGWGLEWPQCTLLLPATYTH